MESIISWNIANANGLLGRKTDDPEFVKIISGNDIICLQETVSEVQLPGYESFSDLRKSGKGGGVTTLVRRDLTHYCKHVNQPSQDGSMNIVVINISNLGDEVFIINTYIPPSNSKGKGTPNCSVKNFDYLHKVISRIREENSGSLLLCGDLNARLGCSPDFGDHQLDESKLPCTVGSDRFSQFTVIPPGAPILSEQP